MHKIQEKILELSKKTDLSGKSLREIGDLTGVDNQPQKIKHHLLQLEKKGFINLTANTAGVRQIKSQVYKSGGLVPVPILGGANCGEANLLAPDNVEGYLKVSPAMLKKKDNIFAIRASGHSMNRANVGGETIEEGDFVIVDSEAKKPENGDYVLSLIDDAANIKKINIDSKRQQIILMSESTKNYPPIYIHQKDLGYYHVIGKVLQVIKKPAV